jgi:hypothetical protein
MGCTGFVSRFLKPCAVAALMTVLAACGGGGGGGEPPPHPPTISNLKYSPATALQAPNGTATINGTFDFADAGGGITSLRIVSSGGADLTVPTPSLAGIKSGTGTGTFIVSVDRIGRYTFELWTIDSRGSGSNRLSGTFEVLPDDTATTWTRLGVSPPAILYGVAWDGQQYVAVGAQGTVMTSPDLDRWTVRPSGVDHTLRSVAAAPSRLVAVGDNRSEAIVLSSIDGTTWSVHYRAGGLSPMRMLSKVIWTGTEFVAVGQEVFVSVSPTWVPYALILTSPDGQTWTQRAGGRIDLGDWAPSESAMSSVAWSGNLLVAVGIYRSSAAWTSIDAENWTRSDMPGAPASRHNLRDITWGNGRFVAVGWDGAPAVFTSTDGIGWQGNSGSEPLPAMNAVTTGASRYLAVSNTFRETSVDGTTWTVTPSTDCGNGVMWDGTRYVSVGVSICRSP